jgi:hypothetical protein
MSDYGDNGFLILTSAMSENENAIEEEEEEGTG